MRINAGLFRGKATTTGEWLYGSLLKVTIKGCPIWIIFEDNFDITGDIVKAMSHACVDTDTVGECTDIPDKNGKLLFEGDIFRDQWGRDFHLQWSDLSGGFVANRVNTMFAHEVFSFRIGRAWCDIVEVVGNIHDNPELLEGGGTC